MKIIDVGGKLLRDKDGNIIATSTGHHVSRTISGIRGQGDQLYSADIKYEVITIYTDAGRPINALREMSKDVYEYNEFEGRGERTEVSSIGSDCNCHGFTFANGAIIIEDASENSQAIKAILEDDAYITGVDENSAQGYILWDTSGKDALHSAKRNSDGSYSADHGYGLPTLNVSLDASKGLVGSQNTRTNFFRRNGQDRQSSTNAGTVKNRVRTVSKSEIDNIREQLGLSSTQELIDAIFYNY